MINFKRLKRYCPVKFFEIENFEEALHDLDQTWDIHHRAEVDEHKTVKELIAENRYYDRPPEELIFLTRADHISLHRQKKTPRKSQSGENNPMYGRHQSEEARRKISEARKELIKAGLIKTRSGCHLSDETKAILSEKAKERLADKTRHPMYGRHMSDEAKKKAAAKKKGKVWANDGVRTRLMFPNELPDGWSLGRAK